jgi:hypothetical protein
MKPHIQNHQRRIMLAHVAASLSILIFVLALLASGASPVTRADERPLDLTPTVEGVGEDQPDPFPATDSMTDTVQLVLDQYLGRREIAPPVIDDQSFAPLAISGSYLPLIQRPLPTSQPPTATPPTATPRPQPGERADVAVAVWPEPSIAVMQGGQLVYELRVRNYGQGDAERIRVTLPYDRRHMRPIGSRLDRAKGDWVSRLTDTEIEVIFGPLDSQASRVGQLIFQVATPLANDTILELRPSAAWEDAYGDRGPFRSNWAPVLIGRGPATAPWVWAQVTPANGPAGTTHTFVSNRFIPAEGIITWLNTPTGVRELNLRGVADAQGVVQLAFSSAGLSPGSYQMVLYGARSQLTGVVTFTVQ